MSSAVKEIHTFPLLKVTEIVSCLEELLQPATPYHVEDLVNPQQSRRIIPLYESLVDMLLMGTVNTSGSSAINGANGNGGGAGGGGNVLDFSCAELLEYPDLHVEALNIIQLFKNVHKLMSEVGVDDFCLRDIIKPEPPRLRKILSGVINFAKFREEKFQLFEHLAKRSDEVQDAFVKQHHRNEDLLDKITNIKLQRTEQEPQVKQLEQVNASLKENLFKLNQDQKVVTTSVDAMKKERNELKEITTNLVYSIEKGRQEIEKLKSGIVKNPEKLKNTIIMMSNDVSSGKISNSELESKIRTLHNKMDVMVSVDQDIEMNIKIMEEIVAERKTLETERKKLVKAKEVLENRQNELRELGVKEQQLKRQYNTGEERVKRLQQQIAVKQGNMDQKLEELHKVYDVVSEERDRVMELLEQNQRDIQVMEAQMMDVCKKMEMRDVDIQKDIRALIDKMENYNASITSSLRLRSFDD